MEGCKMKTRQNTPKVVFALIFLGFIGTMSNAICDEAQAQNIVGTWQCRSMSPTPLGICQGQTILKPDGTFLRSNRCGDLMAGDEGTYTTGQGYIHYNIKNCYPKTYHGKPMRCLESETFYFQWVNKDTVRGQDVECFRSR